MYEYNFTDNWEHQIRLEAVCLLDPRRFYPTCVAGRRLVPPEEIGGPVAFMKTRDHYHRWEVLSRLGEILKKKNAFRKHGGRK
jgi:hypothetical protein